MKANKCTYKHDDGKVTHHLVCKNFETCDSIYFTDNNKNKHCDNFVYKIVSEFVHKEDEGEKKNDKLSH